VSGTITIDTTPRSTSVNTTGTVLDGIIAGVREDLEARRRELPLRDLERLATQTAPARDARPGLADSSTLGLIAEVKRASPSKGALADIPDPAHLAEVYETAGAGAISVLTEQRRFHGSLQDLDAVRSVVDVPVLRKDFTVDPYQVVEARAHGADLVLLIVAALSDAELRELFTLTTDLGMRALVETHSSTEIDRALDLGAGIIGVNARDLRTLEVDLPRAAELVATVPSDRIAIGESGVASVQEVLAYAHAGADAVLVGEALVIGDDPARSVRDFTAVDRRPRTGTTANGEPR
jgi:indole-3-glycerol phosphate synthase